MLYGKIYLRSLKSIMTPGSVLPVGQVLLIRYTAQVVVKQLIGKRIMMIEIKENELYQEIELYSGLTKIGEAEVDLKGKMLSRLVIYEPYQDKGYGTEIVKILRDKYGCDCLWVTADNDRAIHVYEKCGFEKVKPTMYLMEFKEGE